MLSLRDIPDMEDAGAYASTEVSTIDTALTLLPETKEIPLFIDCGPSCLLIIDLQMEFLNEDSAELPSRIAKEQSRYRYVAATKFVNKPDSLYTQILEYKECQDSGSINMRHDGPVDKIFEKTGYSGFTAELKEWLRSKKIEVVHVCGVDTDSGVLATSLALWDNGFLPIVLSSLCASLAGREVHEAALRILKRNIGSAQVI